MRILSVEPVEIRTEVTAAGTAGSLTLQVDDPTEFDAPGWARVDTTNGLTAVLPVTRTDSDLSLLRFLTALPWAVPVESQVVACNADGGAIVSSVEAVVDSGDGGQEWITLDVDPGTDLTGSEVVMVGGTPQVRRVSSLPAPTAPVATVEGLPTGLLVTTPLPAGTRVLYELGTDAALATVVKSLETANSPIVLGDLTPETDYWLGLTATNSSGVTERSIVGPYRTRLLEDGEIATIAADKIVSGDLTAAIALLGSLSVGSTITLSPDQGLQIALPNGRQISLGHPTDEPRIEGFLTTRGLTSEGNANLLGGNNWLRGNLTLAGLVAAPTAAPTAAESWPTSKRVVLQNSGSTTGLWWDGTYWSSCFGSSTAPQIRRWDSLGVQQSPTAAPTGITPYNYASINGAHFILGENSQGWVLLRYASNWAQTHSVALGTSLFRGLPAMCVTPTDLSVLYPDTNGVLRRRIYSQATLALTDNNPVDSTWGTEDIRAAYAGTADYGGVLHLLVARSDGVRAYSVAAADSYTRVTSREFGRPASETLRGLMWNGSNLVGLTDKRNLWTYSGVTATVTRSITSTKYDAPDFTGDPAHETTPSPARTITHAARTWQLLQSDPVGGSGGVNDPDRARFYVANDLQPDVAQGATTLLLGVPVVHTPTPIGAPTENGFALIGGLNGLLQSEAVDAIGPIWSLAGDGPVRLAGITYNAAGQATGGRYRKTVTVTPTAANTATTLRVNFGFTFAQVPVIGLSNLTSDPTVIHVAYSAKTTTYVDVVVTRSNNANAVQVDVTAELPSV